MVAPAPALGIIAGGGSLPARLAASAKADGRRVFVLRIKGQADDSALETYPGAVFRLGAAGAMLKCLRDNGVRDLVMAGNIRRPGFAEARPDLRGALFLAKIGRKALGDDSLLRAIARELEAEGFRVLAAHELTTDILTPEGLIGSVEPPEDCMEDIRRGVEVAKAVGMLDIGQGAVVQQGIVLGVEAIEGTDELIDRCGKLQRGGRGGILVKVRKPQQDNRLDLPTMGTETVRHAAEAGLCGIVMEAGGTLMLDREAVAAAADRAGIFVLGLKIEEKAMPSPMLPFMSGRGGGGGG
jgi:DUF1009 family protein